METVREAAEDTGGASCNVASAAEELTAQARIMSETVNSFIEEMRAA